MIKSKKEINKGLECFSVNVMKITTLEGEKSWYHNVIVVNDTSECATLIYTESKALGGIELLSVSGSILWHHLEAINNVIIK